MTRAITRLRDVAAMAMLGAMLAGVLGFHNHPVQFCAVAAGALFGCAMTRGRPPAQGGETDASL